jgi:LAS seventeen-binding protein 1/2
MNNLNLNGHGRQNGVNEKNNFYGDSNPTPSPAPPAYPVAPAPPTAPPLTYATALYAYTASDAGDLALQANDRVAVTEYMNAEWWKGRNERTKQEGIFPRNYVKVEEKITEPPAPTNYGNMPLDVSNGAGSAEPGKAGKGQEMGKKFGKKLGNAAVFGAGATIGSNIVNSIF